MDDARIPYERCPLCESAERDEIGTFDCSLHPSYKPPLPRTIRWLRCAGCGHIHVDGYFSPAALEVLFSSSNEHQTPGSAFETQRVVSAAMVEKVCARQRRQGGRWLDVGFGNGALITTAAEFGFRALGLDLRAANVEMMREFGLEAYAVPFESFQAEVPLDVISMADVLEHMPFPKSALRHARDLLVADGLLLVSMPNADSFLWQILTRQNANPYWMEIEHYHNFGRRRLYALLRECGFEPVQFGVSVRYRACMEVLARKRAS